MTTAGTLPGSSSASSLLVATSDSTTRALLRKALHVRAVEIVEAADGVEALALTRRLELDLVLLDAFLAVLDGISVCARIRALTEIDQPAIAIMGLSSERTVELALAEGADEILTKPLHPALIRQRVETLLRRKKEEKRLRLMERAVEAAGAGITILDARSSEYPVAYANPAFLAMTAYAPEEILGKNLRLLRGPQTDVAATTQLRDAMAGGETCRVLLKNHRKDGAAFWNDLSASPITDPAGRVTHYVAVQNDVTERMKAERLEAARHLFTAERTRELEEALTRVEERRRFIETILNGMIAAVVTTDAAGLVTFANRAALRTLGMSTADCIGRAALEIFGNNEEVREVLSGVVERPETRLDFPLITPGGVRVYIGMSVMRVPAELRDELGFVVLFRDLAETAAGEAEAALGAHGASRPAVEDDTVPIPSDSIPSPEGGPPFVRRRPVLALRYCDPAELVAQAVGDLGPDVPGREHPPSVEAPPGLPEVLVDREQVVDALARLVANASHRAGAAGKVRVRLEETEALGERGVRPGLFVRVDILFPREEITEADLGDGEDAGRRRHRRADLATAEQLLQANGGRIVDAPPDASERTLSALIPATRRPRP